MGEGQRDLHDPETAGDLIMLGLCSGACLVADEASAKICDCRCEGKWHGAMADAPIYGRSDEGGGSAVRRMVNDGVPLVGQFFHTFKTYPDGCRVVSEQGKVVGRVSDGVYLVQLFEWLMGEPVHREIKKLDDMLDWQFYPDVEAMVFEYEYRGLAKVSERHHKYHVPDAEEAALLTGSPTIGTDDDDVSEKQAPQKAKTGAWSRVDLSGVLASEPLSAERR